MNITYRTWPGKPSLMHGDRLELNCKCGGDHTTTWWQPVSIKLTPMWQSRADATAEVDHWRVNVGLRLNDCRKFDLTLAKRSERRALRNIFREPGANGRLAIDRYDFDDASQRLPVAPLDDRD